MARGARSNSALRRDEKELKTYCMGLMIRIHKAGKSAVEIRKRWYVRLFAPRYVRERLDSIIELSKQTHREQTAPRKT